MRSTRRSGVPMPRSTRSKARPSAKELGPDSGRPKTRPAAIDPDPPGLKWLGLEVRRRRTIDADHAEVEFVARSKLGGRAQRLHETSRFERRDGRWVYVDGTLR